MPSFYRVQNRKKPKQIQPAHVYLMPTYRLTNVPVSLQTFRMLGDIQATSTITSSSQGGLPNVHVKDRKDIESQLSGWQLLKDDERENYEEEMIRAAHRIRWWEEAEI